MSLPILCFLLFGVADVTTHGGQRKGRKSLATRAAGGRRYSPDLPLQVHDEHQRQGARDYTRGRDGGYAPDLDRRRHRVSPWFLVSLWD